MTSKHPGIDQLPSGAWRVRVQHRGETLHGTAPTEEIAIQLRDELKRQIIDGELTPTGGKTAAMLGPRFLGSRNGNRDADTETSRWHRHIANAPWARKPIASVTRADGAAWLRALKRKRLTWEPEQGGRRSTSLSWQSRKHCLNLARQFFAWAVDGHYIQTNPFTGLVVEREDGDEDEGYQDTWYLDAEEQTRFLNVWDKFSDTRRREKTIVAFALGTGLRMGELWCLHLEDVHVEGDSPHVVVRFGSWSRKKERYLSPKGRKGEKKSRVVPLFGLGLEAAKTWLAQLSTYAKRNPLGLMFPTERGARRERPPRSWGDAVEAFGVVKRIGDKPWWHLLRHSFASSLVSGAWGMRWSLEDVSKVLGHTDIRTTQIYAHLAPSALQATALRAHAAYGVTVSKAVTTLRRGPREASQPRGIIGHARSDSNRRLSASKADESGEFLGELKRRDDRVTVFRHVLREIADGKLVVSSETVTALGFALERALDDYAAAAAAKEGRG